MMKFLFCLVAALTVPCFQAYAADIGVSIGINAGAPPVYAQPPLVINEPPEFIAPPQLGFYIAVGVPYDLFFLGGRYYLYSGDIWYSAPYYNGPWLGVPYRDVPYGIRSHPFYRIHHYRDYYGRHPRYYHGREFGHFRPERSHGGWEHHEGGEHGRGGEHYGGEHGHGNHGHRHD